MSLSALVNYLLILSKFKKLLSKKRDLRDTMPRHFLLLPCYLQDTMPCQWSSSDFTVSATDLRELTVHFC